MTDYEILPLLAELNALGFVLEAQTIMKYCVECQMVLIGKQRELPAYLPACFAIDEIGRKGYEAEANDMSAYVLRLQEEMAARTYWMSDEDTRDLPAISGDEVA